MSGIQYDPEHIARFYDEYGAREWERFDLSAMDRVGLEVHLRLLREHIRVGDRVLDAGAGPGRFTLELARLGARVVAGDISPATRANLSTDASVPRSLATAQETFPHTRASGPTSSRAIRSARVPHSTETRF